MDKISDNRDWLIAYWFIQGLSTTEIGEKICIHRSSVYRRLQTNSYKQKLTPLGMRWPRIYLPVCWD